MVDLRLPHLFWAEARWGPGVFLQSTARVVVRGGVPLEVIHELGDGCLLHLQWHRCQNMLLPRALSAAHYYGRSIGGWGGGGGRGVEVTGSGTVLNKHERIGERLYTDNKRAIKRKQMIGEEISMAEEVREEKCSLFSIPG